MMADGREEREEQRNDGNWRSAKTARIGWTRIMRIGIATTSRSRSEAGHSSQKWVYTLPAFAASRTVMLG